MSITEIVVILVGLAFGYWMVSNYIDGRREQAARRSNPPPRKPSPFSSVAAGPTWYQVLDVPEHASAEDIRAAYQRKISAYHPDKMANLGPEFETLANKKAEEINVAYAEGLQRR